MRKLANHAARDIASPAVKMGNRSLFPGVAVPLAFFCTLFFRHRKKSVSAPWDGKAQFAPESARPAPPGGRAGVCACGRTGGFPLAPSPLRIATRSNRAPHRAASPAPAPESARQSPPKGNFVRQSCLLLLQAGGFPRGKQSARFALPCVPLVVCLNSGALTAFGGCAHWAPASLRPPLHPFGKSAYQGGMGMDLPIHHRAFPRGK